MSDLEKLQSDVRWLEDSIQSQAIERDRLRAQIKRLQEERDGLRMPDELVERVGASLRAGFGRQADKDVLREILAWHEGLKEQKE